MASAISVTSVSYVPFRRFLPHEKQNVPTTAQQDYHSHDYDAEDNSDNTMPGMPQPMLSDTDLSILIEAGHPEDAGSYQQERVDHLYLPFTFALAAQQ